MKFTLPISVAFVLLLNTDMAHSQIYEIWQPNIFKEMLENNTQFFTNFISTKTSQVGEAINNYVDEAQKQTTSIHKNISGFFEATTDEFNNTMIEFIERARSASTDFIDNVNVFKSGKDCTYDPEMHLNTLQIIARHGYPAESHTVKTEDGYLLNLHRIPRGKNHRGDSTRRQPVLLHHGLLASSADWIVSGPEKSLAYILADAGYDVWMANVRGNTYSRAHVSLSNEDEEFWNFTFHQVGYYDLPAYIDYINELAGGIDDLMYVGHSMGTSVLFVLLSTRPEYNNKLKVGFALAPVAFMSDVQSPVKYLAPYAHNIELISKFLGNGEFLPQSLVLKWLSRIGCEINNFERKICENTLFVICGYDEKQFNKSLIPIILSHTPAGASTKTLVHYAQEIQAKGRFQMYDFGAEENMAKYNSKTPPEYPIDKITLPIALFSAQNDWLSGMSDAKKLYKQLKNPIEFYEVPMKEFNHLDFLWGIDAPTLVYKRLMELMEQHQTETNLFSWSLSHNNFKLAWKDTNEQ